eukprot:scaffold265426_cov19-Tisochrysis_lutea.AAC.2
MVPVLVAPHLDRARRPTFGQCQLEILQHSTYCSEQITSSISHALELSIFRIWEVLPSYISAPFEEQRNQVPNALVRSWNGAGGGMVEWWMEWSGRGMVDGGWN